MSGLNSLFMNLAIGKLSCTIRQLSWHHPGFSD